MSKSANHFEEFEPHTRLKHLILKTYLQSWARKLLLRPGAGDTVVFIDACAGRGMDDVGNQGSPIIAAKEAAIAAKQVGDMRGTPVHVTTIAIEKRADHYKALKLALAPSGPGARALRGTLSDFLPQLLTEFDSAPILCFIDPFGIEPLRADVVRAVLARPHSEVFVLFADQACLRHFGATAAADEAVNKLPEHDLFSSAGVAVPATEGNPEAEDALQITAERAREILDSAFGDDSWYERIMKTPRQARRDEFLMMYVEFLKACGAEYVLPIPVRNEENQHVYHLVHATHSGRGHIAMKEAVSHALRNTELSDSVTRTIQFAIRTNIQAVASSLVQKFAGCLLNWTSSVGGLPALKEYALANTPIYPHEMNELRAMLKPYRLKGIKAFVYQFPDEPQNPQPTSTDSSRRGDAA